MANLNPTLVEGVNIDVTDTSLTIILKDMIEASQKAYGSHIRIAAKFNNLMSFAWFDMASGERSDQAKEFKTYKTELYAALKTAGHSNPSVPFKRICDYGRNLRNGLAPSGKTTIDGEPVAGSGEGESEGAAPAPRSAMLRNVEELTALWKFNDKQTELPKQVIAAQAHIEAALKALGLDVAHIAK